MDNNSQILYLVDILPFMNKKYFESFVSRLPNHIMIKNVDVVSLSTNIPGITY